jgi:MFS family permease
MATLIVGRFLHAVAGSAFLAVAGGTVVDMFRPQHLLYPMTVFTGAPFVGPAIGPVIGGFICYNVNW